VDVTISWVSPHDAASIAPALRDLLAELSPSSAQLEVDAIVDRLGDDRLRVAIAVADGQLVGSASLTLLVTLADGLVGRVEDVVVCAAARGGGVGRKLMDALHDEARQLDVAHLDLTSRPSREPANAMYLSLGYEHRETNVYRWRLHA
jgi:GNAT superfamily N-acetyltransferase